MTIRSPSSKTPASRRCYGSFVTMFRKALGTSPGRYIAEWTTDQPAPSTIHSGK